VDHIARLPGIEDLVRWYDQFPSLAAARDPEAEEEALIYMMIALDNWSWMPVCQVSHITKTQDIEDLDNMRSLAQTQFGKRLLLLLNTDAHEVIPPEWEEEWYKEDGVGRGTANNGADARAGGEEGRPGNGVSGPEVLQEDHGALQKGRKQAEDRCVDNQASRTEEPKACFCQVCHGQCDRHADRLSGEPVGSGWVQGIRLQHFQQSGGHVLPIGSGALPRRGHGSCGRSNATW
jgi:hypothetical protein